MVKTRSNVCRMFESFELIGGGTSASAAAAPDTLASLAPVEEEGGGITPEDAPLDPKDQLLSE